MERKTVRLTREFPAQGLIILPGSQIRAAIQVCNTLIRRGQAEEINAPKKKAKRGTSTVDPLPEDTAGTATS